MPFTFDAHANLRVTTVATAPFPALSGTSLHVATGTGSLFPATPFNVVVYPPGLFPNNLNTEIVRVTNISGDTFTIIRAQEGTAAQNIVAGYLLALTITAKTLTDIEAAVSSLVTSVQI